MQINKIANYLRETIPETLASDFDAGRIGLVIGDECSEIKNILLALDLTPDVLQEALRLDANFIITHHPFIFDPITKIHYNTVLGNMIKTLCVHNISLYVAHTNLDAARGGVNDVLAAKLALKEIKTASGEIAKHNFMRYGSVRKMPLKDFSRFVRLNLGLSAVRVAGVPEKAIEKVGIIGGAGASREEIDRALLLGLDCFISGEVKLHIAQYAVNNNLVLIEISHGVEKFALYPLKEGISRLINAKNRVYVSAVNTDPLTYDF